MPTWDAFRYKFQSEQQQRERFEDLARSLFCIRYGINYGIFQYVNHAGNETSTINDGTDIVGFQAKFFKNEIDENNIIESIQTARRHNPQQTKVIIYTNLTFGNPPIGKIKTIKQEKLLNIMQKTEIPSGCLYLQDIPLIRSLLKALQS